MRDFVNSAEEAKQSPDNMKSALSSTKQQQLFGQLNLLQDSP